MTSCLPTFRKGIWIWLKYMRLPKSSLREMKEELHTFENTTSNLHIKCIYLIYGANDSTKHFVV